MAPPSRHSADDPAGRPEHARYRRGLALGPGRGCLAGDGRLVLARPGPITCVRSDAPRGVAPAPMEMAALVDAALEAAPTPPRWMVVGADGDPLLTPGAWGEALLAASVRAVERGLGLWVATRGAPLEGAWATLLRRAAAAGGGRLEVGLFSLDVTLAALYEPTAPPPADRLEAARRLGGEGVTLLARVSPLLPWICDTPEVLSEVSERLGALGVREIHTAYLHLDGDGPRRLGRLPPAHRALLRGLLRESPHREGEAWLLPAGLRAEGYRRFYRAASRHGVTVRICGSANPDLQGASRCFAGPASTGRSTQAERRASEAAPAPGPQRRETAERRASEPASQRAETAEPGTQLRLL